MSDFKFQDFFVVNVPFFREVLTSEALRPTSEALEALSSSPMLSIFEAFCRTQSSGKELSPNNCVRDYARQHPQVQAA